MQAHGRPERQIDPLSEHCGGQTQVLDSLIRTLLSQNTTDKTSIRAFISLKKSFPTWDAVLSASDDAVEDAIRVGGLAAIKCQRMKALLAAVKEERGEISLEWLRTESTDFIKQYLSQFKGMGPKTISCVLMFCLHRPEFPVDTHVHHITKDLGWVPASCSREQAYEHLNGVLPADVKYDLHVLLVKHGKVCPRCNKSARGGAKECPLTVFKRSKGKKAVGGGGGGGGKKTVEAAAVVAEIKEEEESGSGKKTVAEIKEEEKSGGNAGVVVEKRRGRSAGGGGGGGAAKKKIKIEKEENV